MTMPMMERRRTVSEVDGGGVLVDHMDDTADECAPSEDVSFESAIHDVLRDLRRSIAATLAAVGQFGKPADIFKTLQLDRTLARQLFHLARTTGPIGNGSIIPSRTAMERFLAAAQTRGASDKHLDGARRAYDAFEQIVENHAGDRSTFNSMVSATGGIDDDWLATDLQHRRNAFRAMSHALGVQMKCTTVTFVVNGSRQDGKLDVVLVGGSIGLRVLRPLPEVRVFGAAIDSPAELNGSTCGPIELSEDGGGYILAPFSASPLPNLEVRSDTVGNVVYREIFVKKPAIGKAGTTSLLFGTVFHRIPLADDEPLRLFASVNHPTEKIMLDVLVNPELCGDAMPTGRGMIGFQMGARSRGGPATLPLQGRFEPEHLGAGADALATLEVPAYADALHAVSEKMNWNLDGFQAYRMRVDFPLFQSTFSVAWGAIAESSKR